MELINNTNLPCLIFKSNIPDNKMAYSVIVKKKYSVVNGSVFKCDVQDQLLNITASETEYGPRETDEIFKLGAVDILVYGKAISDHAVKEMNVKITVSNKLNYELKVFGKRYWENGLFGLSPTQPEVFNEIPLSLFNSYGGVAQWDGLKIPYGNNPYGKGYYWSKEDALHQELPNVESPKNLIQKWNMRPDPVGIVNCPMNELKIRSNIQFNEKGIIERMNPSFFNASFPEMLVPELNAGDKIIIEGMTEMKYFSFEIPKDIIKARIQLGEKQVERVLKIDQLGIFPDKNCIFITYRFPFTYEFKKFQKRSCEIFN